VSRRRWRIPIVACALLAGVTAAGAGAGTDEIEPTTTRSAPAIPCLERAIVVAYLHDFQDQIMQRWVVPEDSLSDQTVVVRFRLDADGRMKSWKLRSWSNRRLANSVELAFRHAEPGLPIPDRAACLIGRSIDIRFENPY